MYKESQLLVGHLDSLQYALLHLTSRDKASLNVAERSQNKAFYVYVLVYERGQLGNGEAEHLYFLCHPLTELLLILL